MFSVQARVLEGSWHACNSNPNKLKRHQYAMESLLIILASCLCLPLNNYLVDYFIYQKKEDNMRVED